MVREEKLVWAWVTARASAISIALCGRPARRVLRPYCIPDPDRLNDKGSCRPDFAFEYDDGRLGLVECKPDTNQSYTAVAQVLKYQWQCERAGVRVCGLMIVTPGHDVVIEGIIRRFNLPIGYVTINDEGIDVVVASSPAG